MLTAHYLTPLLCWFARVELFEAVQLLVRLSGLHTGWLLHWAGVASTRVDWPILTCLLLPAWPSPARPKFSPSQHQQHLYNVWALLSTLPGHSTVQYSTVQHSGVQQPCSITIRDCNEDMERWRGSTLSTKQMREVTSKFQLSFSSQIPVHVPCHWLQRKSIALPPQQN